MIRPPPSSTFFPYPTLFRSALSHGSLVLSSAAESPADFLARAAAAGVTHISGTPSHWRRALMSGAAARISPRYVRLSGEIARSEEHTSELQSPCNLVCRLLLEKKNTELTVCTRGIIMDKERRAIVNSISTSAL